MRRFSTGCGVFVLLLLAFACYRVITMRPLEPRLADLPVAEQKRRRADAQRLVTQAEDVGRHIKRRDKGTWTLTATSEQLNTLIQDRLKVEGVPIQNLGVSLNPGQLSLNGITNYKGFNVPIDLSGSAEAPNGELNFVVQSLTLGGFPVGGSWKTRTQTAITKGLNAAIGKSDAYLEDITISQDRLTVRGRSQKE